MDKLDAELRRLHLSPAEPPASGGQALCLGFRRAADWESVAALWHAAQAELDLPAPAMSIDGEGYRLWFSLAERVADETARRFIDGLIRRYLAELPDARLHIDFAASPPPAELIPDERWAAFIDPGLGSMFAAEPWLDMAPNRNQQADLLAALRSIRPAELSHALDRMLAQEGGGPLEALVLAPGAHLQVEVGGEELQSDLGVHAVDEAGAEHVVIPWVRHKGRCGEAS